MPNAAAFKGRCWAAAAAAAAEQPSPPSRRWAGPTATTTRRRTPAPPLGASASRDEREPARPVLTESPRRSAPTWLWVAGAVAVGFAGSVAAVALLMRPALQDLTVPAPVDTPGVESSPAPKMLHRVGPAATDAPNSGGERRSQLYAARPRAEPRPPRPPSPRRQRRRPARARRPRPRPAPAPAPWRRPSRRRPRAHDAAAAPPAATVPIASRAAMLVATVADAAKPAISVGTAVWTVVPAPAGQPQGIGVKAEIDVPDLKLHASMIMRKNFDASLPASHTIDLRVTFDAGSPIKGVKDIALPLMRRDDPPAADALAGVRVKISDNYFLIGLNRGDSDVARNLQEVAERGWFDFPMQLDDDRIAKLTFEKGADGDKIVAQALAAWK